MANKEEFKSIIEKIKRVSRSHRKVNRKVISMLSRYNILAPKIPTFIQNQFLLEFRDKLLAISKAFEPIRILFMVSCKFADNQFIIWEYLDKPSSQDFLEADNADDWLLAWCKMDNSIRIIETINKCAASTRIGPYSVLFSQSIFAYERDKFSLSIVGLISVIDGLLSDISKNHTTKIGERAEAIFEKIENNENLSIEDFGYFSFHATFLKTYQTLCEFRSFTDQEPELLNRHWIMHGRSRRTITQLDCIKIIRFIYAMILLDEIANEENA